MVFPDPNFKRFPVLPGPCEEFSNSFPKGQYTGHPSEEIFIFFITKMRTAVHAAFQMGFLLSSSKSQ